MQDTINRGVRPRSFRQGDVGGRDRNPNLRIKENTLKILMDIERSGRYIITSTKFLFPYNMPFVIFHERRVTVLLSVLRGS